MGWENIHLIEKGKKILCNASSVFPQLLRYHNKV